MYPLVAFFLIPFMLRSMISRQLLRMARAGLGWSQEKLADEACISRASVARIEAGIEIPNQEKIAKLLQRALEDAGINFLFSDGDSPDGLRLREKARKPKRR